LSLGAYSPDGLPKDLRTSLKDKLKEWFAVDPDSGVHSAVDWLLGQRWGLETELRQIEEQLAGQPAGGRHWFVDKHGFTFAVVPGCADRPAFAIATKEVTVRQFLRCFPGHKPNKGVSPHENSPVNAVSWVQAQQYCARLNQQEGFPPGAGYRLPKRVEWEYACLAGAETDWFFGRSERMLLEYAWYAGNSPEGAHDVGQKKPNDLGVFDLLGNVREWCEDSTENGAREVLGGAFTWPSQRLRANSWGDTQFPEMPSDTIGVRVVRLPL
jgi:hypothetical protein